MCQKYDGMPLITIPLIANQAFGTFWDCAETSGNLHMALTRGVVLY